MLAQASRWAYRTVAVQSLAHFLSRFTDDVLPQIANGLLRTEEFYDGGRKEIIEDLSGEA